MNHKLRSVETDEIIDQVVQLAQLDEQVSILWLYGSRVKGSAHDQSDYDFAVAFSAFIQSPYESRLRPELLALSWQEACQLPDNKLSVVDVNKAPIALAWEIVSTGKLLLVKDQIRYHQEFQRITSMTEWMLFEAQKKGAVRG